MFFSHELKGITDGIQRTLVYFRMLVVLHESQQVKISFIQPKKGGAVCPVDLDVQSNRMRPLQSASSASTLRSSAIKSLNNPFAVCLIFLEVISPSAL